jgi:integrase
MEKLDIHNVEEQYNGVLSSLEECKSLSEIDQKQINKFISDCMIGKNSRKKVGKSRLARYIWALREIAEYFKKPFSKITEEDIERFYRDLQNDKIKKKDGKKYASGTKNEFIKAIKKYFGWLYIDDLTKYKRVFGWIKDFEEDREVSALTKDEIEKIAKTSDMKTSALLMFMFDSGARAEELLNIKLEDLREEQVGKDFFYKVRIKISKTKPRTITLPLASMYLKNWIGIHPNKNNKSAFLFPITYDYLRKILYRKGKILGKRIHPHLLRHSSATYYCNRLNQFQLCYRYGWAMSSKQPQRYIDREGIEEEKTAEIIKYDEVGKLKKENELLKESIAGLKEEQDTTEEKLKEMKLVVEQIKNKIDKK